jgi:hypothetical protein
VFCLGVAYHLRNPMLMMETIAKSAEFCILSTKIARFISVRGRFRATQRVDVSDVPVAYLLDPYEVNQYDATNYWVFSEEGLRRMLKRSGWTVLDYHVIGDADGAEPASADEARAFCLLRSDLRSADTAGGAGVDPGLVPPTDPGP